MVISCSCITKMIVRFYLSPLIEHTCYKCVNKNLIKNNIYTITINKKALKKNKYNKILVLLSKIFLYKCF